MLTLDHPVTKRRYAFLASFDTLFNGMPGRKYFWTITPDGYLSDDQWHGAFHKFQRRLQRALQWHDWHALRVFEEFKSGFLHAHMVCDIRIPIALMYECASRTGIGNLDVRKCVPSDGEYLAKYMTKAGSLGRGVRQWAAWGDWPHSRVRDIEITSAHSDFLRVAYRTCEVTAGPGAQRRQWIEARKLGNRLYLQWLRGDRDWENPF